MLLVCCFCDNVHDETIGQRHWQNLQRYMASRKPTRADTILSYTCCHDCLQGNPHAIAFRARQSRTSVPDRKARTRSGRWFAA